MSAYTVKNLKEIEDAAVKGGFSPDVEARFARNPLGCETVGLSYQRLAPNVRQAFGHKHDRQEEVYVLLGGSARVKIEDDVVDLRPMDALRVAKDATRQFEAGPDGAEFLAFGAPATGEMDARMLPGWWSGD
jgi:mannose-6-phosphate isomerase-like protein (cupin superfamily)